VLSAVLWDMGGPIDRETEYERLIDEDMRRALRDAGVGCSDAEFQEAARWAVASFAPNAYRAMVWKLSSFRAEVARQVYEQVAAGSDRRHLARGGMELRQGVDELLRALHGNGVPQSLVTNNEPSRVLADLARHGLDHCFVFPPPQDPPVRKPNPAVFLNAAAALEVPAASCLVVGDRIDTDVVPAKQLGMTAVLFRTGRHVQQQPRTWEEVPDHEVGDVPQLAGVLRTLGLVREGGAGSRP
jgi:HAD superfamily hydrolase (TIGR01509 family)